MDNIKDLEVLKLLLGIKDAPTYSLADSLEKTKEDVNKNINNSEIAKKTIIDNYGNALTGTGTDDKIKSFTTYGFDNSSLNFALWMSLYNDSWVFRRAIDKPAQDMVRSGVELVLDDNRVDEVQKEIKCHRKELIELIQWGRLFGGAVGVIMFDNFTDEDYAKKLNVEKLKKAKRMTIYITDRWYGCTPSDETVKEMNDITDYGKPVSYNITFSDGHEIKVNHDYVMRYEGRTAPRLIKNGYLQGWGYAEGTHILNELSRDDQLKASITSLINKSLIEVIKMPGMRGLFQGGDNESALQIQKRLEMVNWARNYNSLTFLDKDDEYQEHGFSGLGGLSDLLQQNMWLISSALEMQGILYGDLKNGFSTDEAALERYDETINNLNENYFRPCMHKLIKIIYLWKGISEKVDFTFGTIVKKQQDKDRMESMKDYQSLLSGMLNDGVLTLKQYAIAMKNYVEKGILDLGMSDEEIEKLDDKMEEEMENIDLDEEKEKNSTFKEVKTK